MKKFLGDLKNTIIQGGIYDCIKYLLITIIGLIFTGTVGDYLIELSRNDIMIKYKYQIISLIFLTVLLIILMIFIKRTKNMTQFPVIDFNYVYSQKTIKFEYGEEISKYNLNVKCKSCKRGTNRFYGRYSWTGSGDVNIKCTNKHQKIYFLTRKDSFVEYEIELPKSYKKGKSFEVNIEGNMQDPMKTFIPFFSTSVAIPTDYLEIIICIHPKYNVREVICEEIPAVRTNNDNSEIVQLDEHGEFKWKINKPKLFYKYTIRWEFA